MMSQKKIIKELMKKLNRIELDKEKLSAKLAKAQDKQEKKEAEKTAAAEKKHAEKAAKSQKALAKKASKKKPTKETNQNTDAKTDSNT